MVAGLLAASAVAWAQDNLPPQPGPVQPPPTLGPQATSSGWVYLLAAAVLAVIVVTVYVLVSAFRARQQRRWNLPEE